MKFLIDTNVILDMVFERKGCETAIDLFRSHISCKTHSIYYGIFSNRFL